MDKFMKEQAREKGKYIVGKLKEQFKENGKRAIKIVEDGVYVAIGTAAFTYEKYSKKKPKEQKFIEI